MSLPIYQTTDQNLRLMQTAWAQQLNPVISNPLAQGLQLSNIALGIGNNVINHLLSRKMQGWFITDVNGASVIYRSTPLNAVNLTLNSSAAVIVNIYVF